ncbi:hypothetical protein SUGI_1012580 [Cryptomeria japonica]|nr:hypothetical protein SUGI_1012580 [Cryptomeria japonica]
MENAQLRFGDQASADVKLWLTDGGKCKSDPIHLHSVILERSEFFKAKLSDWSSDKPIEITVVDSHGYMFYDYRKCIEGMYGEWVYFSDVRQCLVILSLASEMLVDN